MAGEAQKDGLSQLTNESSHETADVDQIVPTVEGGSSRDDPTKNEPLAEWTPDFIRYVRSFGGPQKGIDLSHPFSGSGMGHPSNAYQIFLRSAVGAAILMSTPLRSTAEGGSRRLRGTRSMMRTATKAITKPSFAAFRQPFLGIISPKLPGTEVTVVPLTHCTAFLSINSSKKETHNMEPWRVQVLYVHGGGMCGGDYAGFAGITSRLSRDMGGAPVFCPNYRCLGGHQVSTADKS